MAKLVDSSLWIDLTRTRSSHALKAFIASQLDDPEVCLAEPVVFEFYVMPTTPKLGY